MRIASKRDSVVSKKNGSSEDSSDTSDGETTKLIASVDYLNRIESIIEKEMKKPSTLFKPARTITYQELSPGLIEREVVQKGVPIIVTGVMKHWNSNLFSLQWLKENFGTWEMVNSPRDTQALEDLSGWTICDYVDYLQLYVSCFSILDFLFK